MNRTDQLRAAVEKTLRDYAGSTRLLRLTRPICAAVAPFLRDDAHAPALQPIETAPRDGTFILLFGPSGYTSTSLRAAVCRFREGYVSPWRNHAGDAFTDGGPAPTHWMPLPPATK